VSLSQRKFRALLYNYRDVGTDGEVDSTYELVTSGDDDDAWWASKANPTGSETTLGMQAEHTFDAVIGFAAEAPVTEDGAIVIDGVEYLVRSILPRDYGRDEVQVLADRAGDDLSIKHYTTMALTGDADVEATAPAGGPDPVDAVRVVNRTGTGSVVLDGPTAEITYDQDEDDWLSVVRSGTDPSFTFTLSYDVTGLAAGEYTATVDITDENAPHSTITLTVTLTIT
jgi:hypothetical protein